jgi:hypothetical protein
MTHFIKSSKASQYVYKYPVPIVNGWEVISFMQRQGTKLVRNREGWHLVICTFNTRVPDGMKIIIEVPEKYMNFLSQKEFIKIFPFHATFEGIPNVI